MSIELMDPGADGEGGPTRLEAPRLESLDGKKIGLLSNGKANAELLVRETAARFEQ